MTTYFKIGPMYLTVETPCDFPWTDEVRVFRIDAMPADADPFRYSLSFVEEFQPIWGTTLHSDGQMLALESEGIEHRIHLLPNSGEPFALTSPVGKRHYQVLIDSRAQNALKWDRTLLGLFPLEHDCIEHSAFLLHSSYVVDDGEAILFSAPSGHGKSTQADLWAAHAGAEIINGDRTLVFKENCRWFASGFPVCGSSNFCLNRTAPLKAMIYLEKAPSNLAIPLPPLQALKRFYSQAFINRWSSADSSKVSDMLIDLAQQVPVFHYQCTKEPDAVRDLKLAISSTLSESR